MIHGSRLRRALVPVLLTALLAACATDASREAFRHTETGLEAAREQAVIHCAAPGDCAQAWSHARAFVQLHSPTRIERVTDETIETRMPHEFGVAYFWAVRETAADGATTVRLKGMCRGMYSSFDNGPGWLYRSCAAQLRDTQLEFAHEVGGAQ
ncbi:hypothetical protein LMG28688_04865 [Paraburkholderia caffeinitolerans]|uniref:Lipoprotein n=1 Tax=Paraburkholderia caffeinitolerans TaxID=1723730 RepID=A0A6J5GE00_9BURK|nr:MULTISPECIES: hypothetical protein [Paraburkholderia]CAB3799002.1 hypothetical protein LMG28688_04865 [Paraburkholderia caffeinitolerans]